MSKKYRSPAYYRRRLHIMLYASIAIPLDTLNFIFVHGGWSVFLASLSIAFMSMAIATRLLSRPTPDHAKIAALEAELFDAPKNDLASLNRLLIDMAMRRIRERREATR